MEGGGGGGVVSSTGRVGGGGGGGVGGGGATVKQSKKEAVLQQQQQQVSGHGSEREAGRHGQKCSQVKAMAGAGAFGGIFRLKPADNGRTKGNLTSSSSAEGMKRCLTVKDLIPIGVGSTIGAGVYVLVGTAARTRTGPALTLSFLIAGIAAALSALCYAELASRCPAAGSAYHYAYTCVGEVVAWLIGWALILEYTVGAAAVARGVSPNLGTFIGGQDKIPSWLGRVHLPYTDILGDPLAAVVVGLVTILLCVGIKESVQVQTIMVLLNTLVLSFVVVAGVWAGCKSGWVGYKQPGGYFPFGVNGMLGGAAMVFFSYIGFDSVASTAEEVKRPQRDLPLGISLSLLICGGLYMSIAVVLVGLVPYTEINPETPISSAFEDHGMYVAKYIVAAGATAALCTSLLGALLPQPRVLFAMSRDGLLPKWVGALSRNGTPLNATVLSGSVAALLAFSMNMEQLSNMVSVGTLLAFTCVSSSILILRYASPTASEVLLSPPPFLSSPSLFDRTMESREEKIPLIYRSDEGEARHEHNSTATPTTAMATRTGDGAAVDGGEGTSKGGKEGRAAELSKSSNDQFNTATAARSGGTGSMQVPGHAAAATAGINVNVVRKQDVGGKDFERPESPPCLSDHVRSPLLVAAAAAAAPPTNATRSVKWILKETEPRRRQVAVASISAVCIGAPLVAIAAAGELLSFYSRLRILAIGVPLLSGGFIFLSVIREDEAGDMFGQAGGFRCPLVPALPILSIVVNTYLMVNLGLETWGRVSIWLVFGALLYIFYGYWHSKLGLLSAFKTTRSRADLLLSDLENGSPPSLWTRSLRSWKRFWGRGT